MGLEVFAELSYIMLVTLFICGLFGLLRQPLIIGYIVSGIIVGPNVLNIVKSGDVISILGELGVALLLFIVGLSLNLKMIKDVGPVAVIVGLAQVFFTAVVGFGITTLLGFETVTAIYISVAITFSSTIIIMKLLSDKGELDTLYGRICVGVLIVQDLVAIAILIVISSLSTDQTLTQIFTNTIIKGFALIAALVFITAYLFPKLNKAIVKSQEFLLLFSIGWCMIIATVFNVFGFSIEVGALLAGIALSMSPYHIEIAAKLRPLRDFFIVLFFILLGTDMVFDDIANHWVAAIVLSLFVLIGNPLIVVIIMCLRGYSKRTAFLTGTTVAQISEFSLIVIAIAIKVGHIPTEIQSLAGMIGIITIAGSTYLILYAEQIYRWIAPYLSIFEKKGKKKDNLVLNQDYDIILLGCNRTGFALLDSFKRFKKKFLVVDYNPEVVENLKEKGYEAIYGDAGNNELLEEFNMSKVKMIVSTIPNKESNLLLIHKVKSMNPKTIIILVAHQVEDSLELYEAGASYVIMPHVLGGHHASIMIQEHGLNLDKFLKEKVKHVEHLIERKKFVKNH